MELLGERGCRRQSSRHPSHPEELGVVSSKGSTACMETLSLEADACVCIAVKLDTGRPDCEYGGRCGGCGGVLSEVLRQATQPGVGDVEAGIVRAARPGVGDPEHAGTRSDLGPRSQGPGQWTWAERHSQKKRAKAGKAEAWTKVQGLRTKNCTPSKWTWNNTCEAWMCLQGRVRPEATNTTHKVSGVPRHWQGQKGHSSVSEGARWRLGSWGLWAQFRTLGQPPFTP